MKTSNKLLITAVLLFLSLQAVYNVALTQAFNKGDFRDPYKDFTSLDNADFDKITVNGASWLNVKIMQGDHQVWVHEKASFVKITQKGNELILDVNLTGEERVNPQEARVVITCPNLILLKADAVYSSKGSKVTDQALLKNYVWYNVKVEGMQLDSLKIQQDNASLVTLSKNTINVLDAKIGISVGSGPKLMIENGNVIGAGSLDVQKNSELVLDNINSNLKVKHSNTAKVVLSGSSLAVLKE